MATELKQGDRVTITVYGVRRVASVERAPDNGIVWVRMEDSGAVHWFHAESVTKLMRSRVAYDIVFRCTLNGADYRSHLFLRDPQEASEAMMRVVRLVDRLGKHTTYGPEHYRLVSCDVSANQEPESATVTNDRPKGA